MDPPARREKQPRALLALGVLCACAVVAGVWGRLRDLGFPPKQMFDEIYFPVFAANYLQGERFFDLHPPLGKFLIAASIALFGDDPFGWRLMPAVFGCATVGLGALLGWSLTKSRVGALLAAAFLALETMLVAYSRTGVMDGFLVFFILATFLAALLARRGPQIIWVAVLLGLAISVKWAALPVAIPAGYVLWRKGLLRPFLASLWVSAILYVSIVFAERLVLNGLEPWRAWQDVWSWHLEAAAKITAAIPNPWTSPWWSWPLMLHPIRFFFGATPAGEVRVISAIGNPLLWWSSTLAVILAPLLLAYRRIVRAARVADDPLVPLLLGYGFLLLPWVPGTRLPYIYNYLPSYAFAILALVCLLGALWGRPSGRPYGAWAVVLFAAAALGAGLYFLPMAAGVPMSPEALQHRVWLDGWFHPRGGSS